MALPTAAAHELCIHGPLSQRSGDTVPALVVGAETTRHSTHGSPGGLTEHLAQQFALARSELWLKVPWIDAAAPEVQPLFRAVVDARARGVDVRVVLRPEASNRVALQRFELSGVPVHPSRYLHEKEVLIDDRLITFSANFTKQELTRNINSSYEIDNEDDIEAAVEAFAVLWETDPTVAAAGEEIWTDAATVVPAELQVCLGRTRLNPLQAKALPVVFGSTGSIVVTAPTGAGKTLVGVAAALKAVKLDRRKAVIVSPARALTKELGETLKRWSAHGVAVVTLTGDADVDLRDIATADVWVTTTEKFESLFRRSSLQKAVADIGCVVVDEIHFLGTAGRGPLLEAMLARLRLLQATCRIVGLSATVNNVDDVAAWLQAQVVSSTWRPVQLSLQVLGYQPDKFAEEEKAKDDLMRPIVDETVTSGGQVVVFCGSRPKATALARRLADVPPSVTDEDAVGRLALAAGVGLHFRGLSTLAEAEARFRRREINVLVATSTLAQGVNLPARVVVIRDTTLGKDPLTIGDALQMAGRAGRPGLETEAFAFLLAPHGRVPAWRRDLTAGHAVHSRLAPNLPDHILAEVMLRLITSANELRDWYSGTFAAWEGKESGAALTAALDLLIDGGFVRIADDGDTILCTDLGALTSRFLVEVPGAAAILGRLPGRTPTSADDAELLVLAAVVSSVPKFVEGYVSPAHLGQLDRLMPDHWLQALGPKPTPGSIKSLVALRLALQEPQRLQPRASSIGPFATSDLRDIADEAPRYLAWLGACGAAAPLEWVTPVAADLAARIQWRAAEPRRGAGRLLREIEQQVPADQRRSQVPGRYRQAVRGVRLQPGATRDPAGSTTTLTLEIGDSRLADDQVELNLSCDDPSVLPVNLLVRANAGGAPSITETRQWDGGTVSVATPPSRPGAEQVAVDALAIGQTDWWYGSACLAIELDPLAAQHRINDLLQMIPDEMIVVPRRSRLESPRRWLQRTITSVLDADHGALRPYASAASGAGTTHERAWQLLTTYDQIVTLIAGQDLVAPATTLRARQATASSRGLALACLLRLVGLEVGVVKQANDDLAAIAMIDGAWTLINLPAVTNPGALAAVIPPRLPGQLRVLTAPPPPPPAPPPAPAWAFLEEYRAVQGLAALEKDETTTPSETPVAPPVKSEEPEPNLRFDRPSTLSAERRAEIERERPGLLAKHPRAYSRWSAEEDAHLRRLFELGMSEEAIADLHARQPSAIASRLASLGPR